MGRQPGKVGPATTYVAGELRAQKARLEWSLDTIAERSGIPRSTVDSALKGQTAIASEVLFALCDALGLDAGALARDALKRYREAK